MEPCWNVHPVREGLATVYATNMHARIVLLLHLDTTRAHLIISIVGVCRAGGGLQASHWSSRGPGEGGPACVLFQGGHAPYFPALCAQTSGLVASR